MYCNKCGKKNPNDASFCNGCGAGIGSNYQNDRTLDDIQKTPVKAFTSLLLGIISLLFLFFFNMMIGLVLAIVGATFGLVGIKESIDSDDIGMERLAVFLNFAGILIPLLFYIYQSV